MPDVPSSAPDLSPVRQGLSSAQAASRLAQEGPNALPRAAKRTVWRIAMEVASEPMFQLLGAAAGIYLVLGDLSEAGVLMAFLLVIAGITVIQERRAERVLEALQDMTSPRAQVWRDGERQRIAGVDVVREDIIELGEGDRIPADARLLSANDLLVDESLLSGESLPVVKHADGQTAVFAGTMVVAGQGVAQVTATGAHSEIGRIGKVLGAIAPEITPLARQTRQLVRWFSALGLLVSLTVAGLYVWNFRDWLGGALAGITMAMSMLPEEFLLILTVFMAMGAWRLSQHRVLTRRAATIETLGAATVLCTDKTGTLTLNRMAVDTLVAWHEGSAQQWAQSDGPLPESFLALLQHSVLACESTPIDPMERAIQALGAAHSSGMPAADWTLVHEYGLSAELPAMSHVWSPGGGRPFVVACKGAPESVAALCRLPPGQTQDMLARAGALADKGMRVLGVAVASWPQADWPATQQGFDFRLLGLVALADPLRDNVPQAVRECQQAGIRVVMITGDHLGTALAIARQAGIDTSAGGIRGDEITAMSDEALRKKAAHATVFARIAPQQKLRIVQALKANGEVVAMTGDGVNDAPSLKA
ncbi:MAG: HAD-IC family P-type ATPase, partial [Burkholderiaceae bacterium]|nr:HAD-IC family P-type ATPase [Burkholderiaceae bacterium]